MAANFSITGLEDFVGLIAAATQVAKDPFKLEGKKSIRAAFFQEQKKVFDSEGQAQGARWEALKASSLRYRKPGKILHQSGRLRDSLTSANEGDTVIQVFKDKLILGSRVPYARFHQTGTDRMKARPPLVATQKLADTLAQATFTALQKALGA